MLMQNGTAILQKFNTRTKGNGIFKWTKKVNVTKLNSDYPDEDDDRAKEVDEEDQTKNSFENGNYLIKNWIEPMPPNY